MHERDLNTAREWALETVSFEHSGRAWSGRGLLRWDPATGFRLDAFVSDDPDPAGRQPVGKASSHPTGLILREHRTSIRMTERNHRWILAPDVSDIDGWMLHRERRVVAEPRRVIFCHQIEGITLPTSVRALYQFEPPLLMPEVTKETFRLGEQVLSEAGRKAALSWEDSDKRILLLQPNERTMQVDVQATAPRTLSRREIERWWSVLETTLEVVSCRRFVLQAVEWHRQSLVYEELIRADKESASLGRLSLFPASSTIEIDDHRFRNLAEFLFAHPHEARVVTGIVNQLFAAALQQWWQSRELLVATTLEGALRSLYKEPLRQGQQRRDYVGTRLIDFQKDYLAAPWTSARRASVNAFRRLRLRNAHPDWLVEANGKLSEEELCQSAADMQLLARFYGAMILGIAGINDLDPDSVLRGPTH